MDRLIEQIDYNTFQLLAENASMVPVYVRLGSDFYTPQMVFLRFRQQGQAAFLFESAIRGEEVGRYSFVGIAPQTLLTYPNPTKPFAFFQHLNQLLENSRMPSLPHLPPLTGGWIGYIGYDLIREIEHLPSPPTDNTGIPLALLGLFTRVVAFDHLKNEIWLIHTTSFPSNCSLKTTYHTAMDVLQQMHEQIQLAPYQLASFQAQVQLTEGNFTQESFEKAVKQAREFIYAGDAFQVVLSQRFRIPYQGDSFQIYRALRSLNPSPYMFYLQFPELSLIGASPEMLVRQHNNTVQVVPIAGTRWRGHTPEEDEIIAQELLADPKENAEHMMLVDLARNDVGRISRPGSIQVKDFRTVERYSHVMHIISRVYGTIAPGFSAVDTFQAVFPAGTVSGAPKVRAMEIIDELEPEQRNFYAGSVGYFNLTGEMDHCIAIRTILAHNQTLHLQAGAGIVADSDPTREFHETLNKIKALQKAIELANGAIK